MKKIRSILSTLVLTGGLLQAQAEPIKKINLNQADVHELIHVFKGIGEKRAQAIVEFRKTHGPYHSIADLAKVKGFGSSFVERQSEALGRVFSVE